ISELMCRTPSGSPKNVAGSGLWPFACMFWVWGRVAWSADAGSTPTRSVSTAATRMDGPMRRRMWASLSVRGRLGGSGGRVTATPEVGVEEEQRPLEIGAGLLAPGLVAAGGYP